MRSPMFDRAAMAALILLGCGPVAAQQGPTPKQPEPVTDRSPDAERVAETPLRDLNLLKDGIPPVLQAAARDPYATAGLARCAEVAAAVEELDRLLGPDFDRADVERGGLTAGKVAQSAVGALIPFRGLIREVSGAASAERQLQVAIFAGATRRGFLKGLGLQRGCHAPARPAPVAQPVKPPE